MAIPCGSVDFRGQSYTIPADYDRVFQGNLLIITGVGRSGTTILGKLIGSMQPTCYLFEPAVMKLAPFLCAHDEPNARVYALLLKALLFEDYFLQELHGRSLNFNRQGDSYFGNYVSQSDVESRWRELRRRRDVMTRLEETPALFVVKTPEFQPLLSVTRQAFPGVRFIHIIRDGNDVVSSTVRRGWYTDDYMNSEVIDWVVRPDDARACNVPFYLDRESTEHFAGWSQVTRAASVWRNLTEIGMAFCAENPDTCFELKYEHLVESPETFVRTFEGRYGVSSTEITRRHIESVRTRELSEYPPIHNGVEPPEQDRFAGLMRRLGYLD